MRSDGSDSDDDGGDYVVTPADDAERALLVRYLARRREELVRLRAAIAALDFTAVRRIGHNLAGSGTAYGLIRVSCIGKMLERAAERHLAEQLTADVAELERFLDRVRIGGDA